MLFVSFKLYPNLLSDNPIIYILLVDGAREIIGLSLNKLGYSLNDTNNTHLREAESNLTKLGPNVKDISFVLF